MSSIVNVNKHILFRIAGESFDLFAENKRTYARISEALARIEQLDAKKKLVKDKVCDLLFEYIKEMQNDDERKVLINFKRDFFNNRSISEAKLHKAIILFDTDILSSYRSYAELDGEIENIKVQMYRDFGVAQEQDIQVIRELSSAPNFNNGLFISSELLYDSLKTFAAGKHVDESDIIGIWKYLTRTVAKTTPFSTLTQLNLGVATADEPKLIRIESHSDQVNSHIRYNNYILEIIMLIVKSNPMFVRFLHIKINSTISITEQGLHFFTNNNNIESFQTVKNNGIIDFIVTALKTKGGMRVGDLIAEVLHILEDHYREDDVYKYIFELSLTGLLMIDLDLSGLDSEWDKSILGFVSKYLGNEESGNTIISLLNQLIASRNSYGALDTEGRRRLIVDINKLFNELIVLFQPDKDSPVGNFSYNFLKSEDFKNVFLHKLPSRNNLVDFKNIIYEDSTRDVRIYVQQDFLNRFVSNLEMLMRTFSKVCKYNFEKKTHFEFYETHFGEAKEVNLLTFYEVFYKENQKNQNQNQQNNADPVIADLNQVIQKVLAEEHAAGKIRFRNDEVEIDDALLTRIAAQCGEDPEHTLKSYSAFVQFYPTGDGREMNGVLSGGIMPGKGKMVSRFLYLFDEGVTREIMAWNTENMEEGELFAENSDASFFNANLHPCLMPREIEMPGGHNRRADGLLNVAQLRIVPDAIKKELMLYDQAGKRVYVFDLGFQSLMGRSYLYRLLCSFGFNDGYPYPFIAAFFNNLLARKTNVEGSDLKISFNPRIVFRNVVLQRRQWFVPVKVINAYLKKHHSGSAADTYVALQHWRCALGVPDEVFIRLYNTKNDTRQIINKDNYKPQYIHFLSPVCIRLFIRMINKIEEGSVTIEEMLPGSEQLLDINNRPYVTESIVQWQKIRKK